MTEDPNKKPESQSDVLKKLKEVRKKLQESLSEGEEKATVKTPQGKPEITPGATETARIDKEMAAAEKVGETVPPSPQRQLYRAGGEETAEIMARKAKGTAQKPRLTAARLSAIQRRVRASTGQLKSMGKGKRVALIIALVIAILPLILTMQLTLVACEFQFSGLAIAHNPSAPGGELAISIPVRNPQFIPAYLGQVQLSIYDPATEPNELVLTAVSVSSHIINPYDTVTVTFQATLNPSHAGDWISGLLTEKKLNILIRDVSYGGLTVPNDIIPSISLDLSGLLTSMLGSLDIGSMVSGLLGDLQEAKTNTNDQHIERDLWAEALATSVVDVANNLGPNAAEDDLLGGLMGDLGLSLDYLEIAESATNFTLDLTMGMKMPSLGSSFELGPIVISNLSASIYTNNVDPVTYTQVADKSHYTWEFARMEMLPSAVIGDKNTHNVYTDNRDGGNDAAYIVLDGVTKSYISIRMTLFKDNTTAVGGVHPSSDPDVVDWDNVTSISDFAAQAKQLYPTWYFLNFFLNNGSIDMRMEVSDLDIEIFGVPIHDMKVDIIPPIYIKDVLKIDNLMSLLGVGFGDGLAMFLVASSTGGLALPAYLQTRYKVSKSALTNIRDPITAVLNQSNLMDSIMSMIDLSTLSLDLDNMIHESWGSDANLTISLTMPINMTLFDIHVGITDMAIQIGGKLPYESEDDAPTYFLSVNIGGNGTNELYLNGINNIFCVGLSITILKNETMLPYVTQFLRNFIESFTLDAWLSVHLGGLKLFDQNMTINGIDLALPLKFELGPMLDSMLGGIVGSMVSGMLEPMMSSAASEESSVEEAISNPLTVAYALPIALASSAVKMALEAPETAQSDMLSSLTDMIGGMSLSLNVDSTPVKTSIDLTVSGLVLNLKEMGIPLTLGMGYTTLSILGPVENAFGATEWNNMITIRIDNYIDLASSDPQSIVLHVDLYENAYSGGAICNFLDGLLQEGILSLKIEGNLALNLSGIFLDDLDLSLKIQDADIGLNVTALINTVVGMISGSSGDDEVDWGPVPSWWTGDSSSVSLLEPLTAAMEMGDLMGMVDEVIGLNLKGLRIIQIKDENWPSLDPDTDHVHISIGLPITNKLMTIQIPQLEVALFADDEYQTKLLEVTLDPETTLLRTNQEVELVLNVNLLKSTSLETWINDLLSTFSLSGYFSLNVSIKMLGCTIGPISIDKFNITALGLGASMITELLDSFNPFNPEIGNPNKVLTYQPNSAQLELLDVIGQFGLGWVEIAPARWDSGAMDVNEEYPMVNISIGLAVQPEFNISISGADNDPKTSDLQLCDSQIFNAIYDLPAGSPKDEALWNTAVKYSKVVDIYFRNTPVYFNNTYSGSAGQDGNLAVDPHKPYNLHGANLTRGKVCQPSYDENTYGTGEYTWDYGTVSAGLAGSLVQTFDLGYRKEAIGAQALQITEISTIATKTDNRSITGFENFTFMARRTTPGWVNFTLIDGSGTRASSEIQFNTTEWQRIYVNPPDFWSDVGIDGTNVVAIEFDPRGGDLRVDDLSIITPTMNSYISWGDAGILDNDEDKVTDSTFNFLEINVLMYNMSHPSFAYSYPRELWRKLGGPYFAPVVYGKEQGGYPDHKVKYPAYFSPYANFLTTVIGLLGGILGGGSMTDVIGTMLGAIELNGSLTANVFGMDFTVNVGIPLLRDLLGTITTLLGATLYRVVDKATNPFSDGTPFPAQLDDMMGMLGSLNIQGLNLGLFLFGVSERNDHSYCPQYVAATGSNINPYDYFYNQESYIPGLATDDNPNGMNTETFIKDDYYNNFKLYTEAWAEYNNIQNPYFESRNPFDLYDEETDYGRYDPDGSYDLRDPDSWALKYLGDQYGGTGRCRTWVMTFCLGLSIPLTVTLLGVSMNFLFDSPYVPCGLAPGGYIWVNETQECPQGPTYIDGNGHNITKFITPWYTKTSYPTNGECGRDPRFAFVPTAEDPHPVDYDANGKVIGSTMQDGTYQNGSIGNWLFLNIRLFEGPCVFNFLQDTVMSAFARMAATMSISCANASVFGYELYNIGGLALPVGPHLDSAIQYCNTYGAGSDSGSAWSVPTSDGSPTAPKAEPPAFPPKMPGFDPPFALEFQLELSFKNMLAAMLGDLIGLITENLEIQVSDLVTLITTGMLHIRMNALQLNSPISVSMWLRNIVLDIDLVLGGSVITVGGCKSDDIWVEFDAYPGQVHNPYDFSVNPLTQLWMFEPVALPNLDIYVQLPADLIQGIINLLGGLIGGGGFQFGLGLNGIIMYISMPAEWEYTFPINAMDMLGGELDIKAILVDVMGQDIVDILAALL